MKEDKEVFTAKEFHHSPGKVYRAADLGKKVIINNANYSDKVFELTARERREGFDDEAH